MRSGIPIPPMPPTYRRTDHKMGVFVSLITGGIWLPFYLLVAVSNSWYNKRSYRRYHEEMYRYNYMMEQFNGAAF